MGQWIEPPKVRAYIVSHEELLNDYSVLNEDGELIRSAEVAYRIVRIKDGRVFKPASWRPSLALSFEYVALEEI